MLNRALPRNFVLASIFWSGPSRSEYSILSNQKRTCCLSAVRIPADIPSALAKVRVSPSHSDRNFSKTREKFLCRGDRPEVGQYWRIESLKGEN